MNYLPVSALRHHPKPAVGTSYIHRGEESKEGEAETVAPVIAVVHRLCRLLAGSRAMSDCDSIPKRRVATRTKSVHDGSLFSGERRSQHLLSFLRLAT